jgi:hypothetical protein
MTRLKGLHMATIIQNTEFVPVVVDPPVQRTTTETKVCFFLSQRSGGKLVLASSDANSQVTRADMIVARSQSFQADFSSVAFMMMSCGYGLVQSYTALRGKRKTVFLRMDI